MPGVYGNGAPVHGKMDSGRSLEIFGGWVGFAAQPIHPSNQLNPNQQSFTAPAA
jgi:hypothetical protein